jgi:hypothetical protein
MNLIVQSIYGHGVEGRGKQFFFIFYKIFELLIFFLIFKFLNFLNFEIFV